MKKREYCKGKDGMIWENVHSEDCVICRYSGNRLYDLKSQDSFWHICNSAGTIKYNA